MGGCETFRTEGGDDSEGFYTCTLVSVGMWPLEVCMTIRDGYISFGQRIKVGIE